MRYATKEQGGYEELFTREETGMPFSASRNLCRDHGNCYSATWTGLTFELSSTRRHVLQARCVTMVELAHRACNACRSVSA